MPGVIISALGVHTPPKVLSNFDLEKMVATNNQWIMERVGISERRIAAPDVATSDMAVEAACGALRQRGIHSTDIEAIIVCTVTPDMMFPSTACLVQNRIGAKGAWGFDLVAACSGFTYGLTVGAQLVRSGAHKRVLVIGADTMSRIIDYTDRSTCVLFGDGAGAMLLEASEEDGFIGFQNEIDGSGGEFLKMPAGGSRLPASADTVAHHLHFVKQEGPQVFKFAVRKMYEVCRDLMERHQVAAKDLKLMIPHQANLRIIDGVADRLGLTADQVVVNIQKFGNTTAATIPLATNDAINEGRLKKGDIVLFAAVGAGFTVGANLWRWAY